MRLNTGAPHGPMDAPMVIDPDELRLRGIEGLLRSLQTEQRAEARRREQEDERRAAWDRGDRAGQLARYELEAAELRARIEARKVHVRTQAQADLDHLRRQRLDSEEATLRARLDAIAQQRADLVDEP